MKIKILFLFAFFFATAGFSQEVDSRLLKVYSVEELNEIRSNSLENYNALVYGLEHGIEVIDLPSEKPNPSKRTITVPNGEYNYADLGLKIESQNQYFQIQGTNKIILLKSFWVLNYEQKNNQ